MQIVLKNEGSIAATARFDVIKNDCFSFIGNMNHTITPKSYHAFDIGFTPKAAQVEKMYLTFNTQHNPYEQHRVLLMGEGYAENVTFEGLPEGLEDELAIGDCIVNKAKSAVFQIVNNGEKAVKFRWNQGDKEEFKFYPSVGHLAAKSSKQIKIWFKSSKTVKYDKIDLLCETFQIEQKPDAETGAKYRDWDDTMKTVHMVRPSEYKKIMKQREEEERKRKEEAEAAAAAAANKGKAPPKAPAKAASKEETKVDEIVVDMSEDPSVELVDTLPEPENAKVEGTDKNVPLKTTLLCDQVKYDCQVKNVDFKPTLMYAQRTYKFTVKNTSLITLNYNWKIVNSETGILDAGAYTIVPKKGSISAGCDDTFVLKFSPVEVEHDFSRILSANIENLSPDCKPLIIEVNGVAERPICHFELPPSTYKERKEKDMVAVDSKYKIVEFDSLGTNIKNTKRFMAVNPTSQGYEFEWEEIFPDEHKKPLKPLFKCSTPKGVILSGKKFEMVFEYTPENVGEHESFWLFKVPTEKIVQHFMVVGRVVEPNVLFESGKIKFGPLLLDGKNREVVNMINQEQIPFSFNFSKESVKGSTEYGDSLRVSPMTGVVPPGA
jgi:hydrocephalus-inducing protein